METNEFCSMLKDSKQFDDLEIRIVRSMLKLANRELVKATANTIAIEAGMSVTNAYKYLYSLEKKGLVESGQDKNKVFWLTMSTNPFPRIMSYVSKDYIRLRELFSKIEKTYDEFIDIRGKIIWQGEKAYEQYDEGFERRAAFLFDVATNEILITTKKFFEDIVLLEAIKRAVERGVKIRVIASEMFPPMIEKLRKINIEMRLGRALPYLIVVDEKHGMTMDENEKGIWFLNCKTDYKDKFEEFWNKAHAI
ncbi:MAG: helix-turn-helix domain-containing protein [Candidatus Aenigmatarchaeota archaeon]